MTLGDIIKTYRSTHNLTMQQFAESSGISKALISMLENNKNPNTGKPITPTLPTCKLIAKTMNMNIDELLKMIDGDTNIDLSSPEISTPNNNKELLFAACDSLENYDEDEKIKIYNHIIKHIFG